METIRVNTRVCLADYRSAAYFGLFTRCRRSLFLMLLFLLVNVISFAGAQMGVWAINFPLLFIMAAYMVWLFVLFAALERDIHAYMKSSECLIDHEQTVLLHEKYLRFSIPECGINVTQQTDKLTNVYELGRVFLFYVSDSSAYILPKSSLTGAQLSALREYYGNCLGNKFSTRAHYTR